MVERMLGMEPPVRERALVLSHNDLNPGNLVVDGERLLLVDWEHAAPNDPFYDLATISVFLAMDGDACARLLAAYDAAPVSSLPAGFLYNRQLVSVFSAATFLTLAGRSGHEGAAAPRTLDETPGLVEFFQRMRTGAASLATGEGQWDFGLALLRESAALD